MRLLWSHFRRPLLAMVLVTLCGLLSVPLLNDVLPAASVLVIAVWVFVFALTYQRLFGLAKLLRRTWRFRRLPGPGFDLYYGPDLDEFDVVKDLHARCRAELAELAHQFGFSLTRRVAVVCFRDMQKVMDMVQGGASGLAMPGLDVIVVSRDGFMYEALRHELVHLYTAKWHPHAPAFLMEGIAVWLQGTRCGMPVDEQAALLAADPGFSLEPLFDGRYFYRPAERDANYLLAGSFTGYLIRRYGWKAYERVFRNAHSLGVRQSLEYYLRRPVADIECEWKRGLRGACWPHLP